METRERTGQTQTGLMQGFGTSAHDTGLEGHPAIRTASLVARILLGVIFLVSGAEKLAGMEAYALAISKYDMLPASFSNIFAALVVWAEIAIAVLLIAGAAVRGAALLTGGLLTMFIIAVLSAMLRGLEIDCGCFQPGSGTEPEQVGWPKIFENLALLAAAVFLIYFPRSWFTADEAVVRNRVRSE